MQLKLALQESARLSHEAQQREMEKLAQKKLDSLQSYQSQIEEKRLRLENEHLAESKLRQQVNFY